MTSLSLASDDEGSAAPFGPTSGSDDGDDATVRPPLAAQQPNVQAHSRHAKGAAEPVVTGTAATSSEKIESFLCDYLRRGVDGLVPPGVGTGNAGVSGYCRDGESTPAGFVPLHFERFFERRMPFAGWIALVPVLAIWCGGPFFAFARARFGESGSGSKALIFVCGGAKEKPVTINR